MFSQEEIFWAIAYGALKARAGRLAPGEIFNIGEFELIVAEDENGEGVVVQIIETMANMESLVLSKMRTQDTMQGSRGDHDQRDWMAAFWRDLAQYLDKWQNIKNEVRTRRTYHLREGGEQVNRPERDDPLWRTQEN